MTSPLLDVEDLRVSYGSARALFGVSFQVQRGTVVAALGSNGAGKSTLARAISGLVPAAGSIRYDEQQICGWAPDRIRRAGLVHLPETRGVFPGLTVQENIVMATRAVERSARPAATEQAFDDFPILGARGHQRAGTLSGGEQQMLALACALAGRPRLLVADELSLGLAPLIVDAVIERIERAVDDGVSVILIEQFVHRAIALADTCLILRRGVVAWCGAASNAGAEVLDRYLGSNPDGPPRDHDST